MGLVVLLGLVLMLLVNAPAASGDLADQGKPNEPISDEAEKPGARLAEKQSDKADAGPAGGFVWCDKSKTSFCLPCDTTSTDSTDHCVTSAVPPQGALLLPVAAELPEDVPPSTVDVWALGGLRTNFGTQSIPLFNYEIGADTDIGFGVPNPLKATMVTNTNTLFGSGLLLTALSITVLDWAFSFPLSDSLIDRSGVLARSYAVDFFGFGLETSLYRTALSVTMALAALKTVKRGLIAGATEVLLGVTAFVIVILVTLTSSFGDLGIYVTRTSSNLAGGVANFAAGDEQRRLCGEVLAPPSLQGSSATTDSTGSGGSIEAAASPTCTFGHALQLSLVERPYEMIQWGQVLDGVPGLRSCADLNYKLLREGRHGNDDRPREMMASNPECAHLARYNSEITWDRWVMAGMNLFAQLLVTLLVLILAGAIFWQQVKVLLLTALLPHALVFAILPGVARRTAFAWLWSMLGVIATTVTLATGLVVWLSLYSFVVFDIATPGGFFLSLVGSVAMSFGGFGFLWKTYQWSKRIVPASGRWVENATVNAVVPVDGGLSSAWRREQRPGRGLQGLAAYSMLRDYKRVRHIGSGLRRSNRRRTRSQRPGSGSVRRPSPGSSGGRTPTSTTGGRPTNQSGQGGGAALNQPSQGALPSSTTPWDPDWVAV